MKTLRMLIIAVVVPLALASCSTDTVTDPGSDPGTSAGSASGGVPFVDAGEARQLVDDGAAVIDVRTPSEFASGHLAGATNIDVQAPDFHEQVGRLDRGTTYVLYCRSGARAGAAGQMMVEMGFEDVVNAGGFETLAAGGLRTE